MNFAELLTERRSTGTGDIMATDADDSIKALEGSADHSEHDERLGLCAHGEFFLECNMGECGDDAMSPLRSTIEHAEDVCECDVCEERRLGETGITAFSLKTKKTRKEILVVLSRPLPGLE